jgi:hypothetical protein
MWRMCLLLSVSPMAESPPPIVLRSYATRSRRQYAATNSSPSIAAETAAQADELPPLVGDDDHADHAAAPPDGDLHPELRPFSVALMQHAGMSPSKIHLLLIELLPAINDVVAQIPTVGMQASGSPPSAKPGDSQENPITLGLLDIPEQELFPGSLLTLREAVVLLAVHLLRNDIISPT